MKTAFEFSVAADSKHATWSGHWQALRGEWPPAGSLIEPSCTRIESVAVVRFSETPTASTWARLATILSEAVADKDVNSILLVVSVRACQVAGLKACCERIRYLARQKPIVAHVERCCLGAAMNLLDACPKRVAAANAEFGGLSLGQPFAPHSGKGIACS